MTHEEILEKYPAQVAHGFGYVDKGEKLLSVEQALKAMAEAVEEKEGEKQYCIQINMSLSKALAHYADKLQTSINELAAKDKELSEAKSALFAEQRFRMEDGFSAINEQNALRKEIADNKTKHQLQLDLQWDAAKALESERDLLVKEIAELKKYKSSVYKIADILELKKTTQP